MKAKRLASKPDNKRPRSCFPPISEEMKAWAAGLKSDVETWPQVTTRAMFGFTACYRRDTIFALLPKSRAVEVSNALAFKLLSTSQQLRHRIERDSRIGFAELQKARWFTFVLSCDGDVHDALEWLSRAHRQAA